MDTGLLHRSCWLEIDLTAVKNNMLAMKRMVGPGILVMPAVKANAYGHGIVACCRALQDAGADILGVGNVDDAILLRRSGLVMPLLVFAGNTVSEAAELYVAHNLMPTILSVEQAKSISAAAHIPHPVFIKIETGFGRLGVNAEAAAEVIRDIAALPNIRIDGIYSHMGGADWPEDDADATEDYFLWQYQRFGTVLKKMKEFNIAVPFRQLANTPGSIVYPGIRMTGICPGRAVWGYSPVERRAGHPDIAMAMTAWKSRLIQVKEVIGGRFGPGGSHIRLEKPRRVGVLAGGLSDGVSLRQAGGSVLIRGRRVPVLGPIFLEHT
ncbi:MAG: alanine racemase, partial [Methylobacteriaceae bacterium]|nr:alanine racemase [Methylobacteriaceae bacterium]